MKNRKEFMELYSLTTCPTIEGFKFYYKEGGIGMLSEQYKKTKLTENEKLANKLGATDEDGILTDRGMNLLATILLEDKDIADKFYKALKKIDDDEEE